VNHRCKGSLVAIALIAWCAAAGPAAAQVSTGMVSGTVKDGSGAVIPGATVVLVNEAQGTKSAPTVTNAQGEYVFVNVGSGTYTLDVSLTGFKALTRKGVAVSSGDRLSIPTLVLEVGGLSEVVDVTAETPLIQGNSGERSYTVTTEAVSNLPIASRSYIELASLSPGVQLGAPDPNTANSAGSFFPPMRLGGGSGVNDTITLDGAGIIDTGGANIRLAPNVDAISEVKVVASSYQAEYGRGSGVQIQGVTKSGSNQFRGSLYDVERQGRWNANTWVNQQQGLPKPINNQRDWGYTIGGPVGKPGGTNKLFFFFSDEYRPRTSGGEQSQFRLPTAAERTGDFSQSRDSTGALFPYIKNPALGLPCSAANTSGCYADGGVLGKIPAGNLYQVGLNMLSQFPLPTDPVCNPATIASTGAYTSNNSYNCLNIRPTRSSYLAQHSLRADDQISQSLRANAKMVYETKNHVVNAPDIAFPANATSAAINGYNDALETQPQQFQYTASANWSINTSTFLEATWGMFQNQSGAPTVSPVPKLGNLPLLFPNANIIDPQFYAYQRLKNDMPLLPWISTDSAGNLLAAIIPAPTYTAGSPAVGALTNAPPSYGEYSFLNVNTVNDVTISLTKLTGRHTIKAGYFFEHSLKEQTSGNFKPSISFAPSTSNPLDRQFAFANAATGAFTSYSQSSRFLVSGFVGGNDDFYLQDNWKVSSKLTLDYGLRFVHQIPGHDSYGLASNWVASAWVASNAVAVYRPVCAAGVATCTGNAILAFNPKTGQTIAQSTLVGTKVPSSGDNSDGLYLAGTGPVPSTTYLQPKIVYGPRFGVAYDVSGKQKLVIRSGGGLYFDTPFGTAGPVNQPPTAASATLGTGSFANNDVVPGGGSSSELTVSNVTSNAIHSKIATSAQYNAGVQMAIPLSMVLDVAYVGSYNYNQRATADLNGLNPGALFLAQNQDPTKAASFQPNSAVYSGINAYTTNLIRPVQGYGSLNQAQFIGWNRFNSLQASVNRRFKNGVQLSASYTHSSNHGTDGQGLRYKVNSDGTITINTAEQATLDAPVSSGATGTGVSDLQNVARVNFVWQLPGVKETSAGLRALSYVVNGWQLSGVVNYSSGVPYSLGYSYALSGSPSASLLTGSTIYSAKIVIPNIAGLGAGCSSNLIQQFTALGNVSGPQYGSTGLESGSNYLRGCAAKKVDLALAKNFRLGHGRSVSVRMDGYNVFNTVNITNRNTTVSFASLADPTNITNLPVDASGHVKLNADGTVANIAKPGFTGAGLGVATAATDMRKFQFQVRFSF
jgi:Carboxypeptidase regulatory-like domain